MGLEVNGAGDIFAALFIRQFLSSGLEFAVETSSVLTTEYLTAG